jgi:tetratricopeptide (TPR) repeat protein
LDRAIQLHQAGDFQGAIREYQACIALDPNRVEARSNLGAVYAKLGRYQDAIDQYQAALKVAQRDLLPRLRFNLALAYYKSFQIPEAAAELQTLRREQPTDLNLALLLADCRLRTGEFQSAIDVLAPLEASHPDQPALDYVLGMALLHTGRIPEGQARVDRILRRGDSAEGRFLLGASLFMAGNFPGAVVEFSKAAALNPDVPSLQSYYGQALLFTGDADAATQAFRKELAANPNDFDANFQLASILAHRGKPAEARPLLERAVQVRPASAEARDALANGFRADQPSQADPGVAVGAPAPAVGTLEFSNRAKPVVLVFGSYTCPKLRDSAAGLKRVADQYRDRVDFRLVYIREAHAQDGAES